MRVNKSLENGAAAIVFLLLSASAASADPITQAVTWLVTKVGVSAAFAQFALQIAASTVLSALGSVLAKKDSRAPRRGIKTPYTLTGETNPESFIVGRYATAGQLIYPPLTHGGASGKEYKVFVVAISCIQGADINRVAIGGEWIPITSTVHPDYGNELGGKYAGHAWLKFLDGSQVSADPMMLAEYGSHPNFPWTNDMIGVGVGVAIVTLKFNPGLFSGSSVRFRFEVDGVPLYDPRKDSTAGGSGSHRWDDKSTWERSSNPIVIVYNILRGIDIGGGEIWGGNVDADHIPFMTWAAAADVCDEIVGGIPKYEAGLEISLDQDPASVIEAILDACAGDICLSSGRWLVRAGPPSIASSMLVDDDILVSSGRSMDAARPIMQTHNAVRATYVEPADVYQSRESTEFVSDSFIVQDGGYKLVASVDLPAVTKIDQVVRLQRSWLADDRRWRTHDLPLPPRMATLEPFDVVAWSSDRNSYSAKSFEVVGSVLDIKTMTQRVTLREVSLQDWV